MAKLSTTQRSKLHSSDFAGPGRSYPVPDKDHAKAAIIDSARGVKAGHITSSERASIVARAKAVLAK
jgi:hypothetical protein